VVLTDRYIYSLIARAQVRGVDPQWIRNVLGFALVPDVVFYLKIDIPHLLPRVINSQGFDYWESGMDYLRSDDIYENYVRYQGQLITQFEKMSEEYHFHVVDANRSVPAVFTELRRSIQMIVEELQSPADGALPAGTRRKRPARASAKAAAGPPPALGPAK
jgi:dTMP kinase